MFKRVIAYYKEGGLKGILFHLGRFFRRAITPLYMLFWENIQKPDKKIVFCNFAGKGYGGYPKFICDELIRRKSNASLIWLVNGDYEFPNEVEPVNIDSYRALKELATAKVWVDNCRKSKLIRKGKKQFYLQTWHGGGPCLKMIEGDAKEYLPKAYIQDALNDTKMADLFVSDCKWQNENYRRAFWYNGEILNCTTPPNDLFYVDWNEVRKNVCTLLDIDQNKHIVLYAPTFRNSHDVHCYDIDYNRVLSELHEKFGGEWVFILRIHPTMMEKQSEMPFNEKVLNGTSYPQIEDLLIAADVLITDFSASMFLAFRWEIPSFLYASDVEHYLKHERPLYFKLNELPASFSSTNDELLESINSFSRKEYSEKCKKFSKSVGFFEGGQSVQLITDRIEKELNRG